MCHRTLLALTSIWRYQTSRTPTLSLPLSPSPTPRIGRYPLRSVSRSGSFPTRLLPQALLPSKLSGQDRQQSPLAVLSPSPTQRIGRYLLRFVSRSEPPPTRLLPPALLTSKLPRQHRQQSQLALITEASLPPLLPIKHFRQNRNQRPPAPFRDRSRRSQRASLQKASKLRALVWKSLTKSRVLFLTAMAQEGQSMVDFRTATRCITGSSNRPSKSKKLNSTVMLPYILHQLKMSQPTLALLPSRCSKPATVIHLLHRLKLLHPTPTLLVRRCSNPAIVRHFLHRLKLSLLPLAILMRCR